MWFDPVHRAIIPLPKFWGKSFTQRHLDRKAPHVRTRKSEPPARAQRTAGVWNRFLETPARSGDRRLRGAVLRAAGGR